MSVKLILAFSLLNLFTHQSTAVKLGDNEQKYIDTIVADFEKEPTHPRYNCVIRSNYPSCSISKVFIWCPIKHFGIVVLCPVHNAPLVFHSWTRNVKDNKSKQPRLVYDLRGNILLLQSIYRCNQNLPEYSSIGHEYHSGSSEIMQNINSDVANSFPVHLYYRSACSNDLLDYVIVHIGRGQNFMELTEDIVSINFRAFLCDTQRDISDSNFYENVMYSPPSNDQLMHIFLSYFNRVETLFHNELAETPCTFLSCDHTFKVSKHIGVMRKSDNKFVNQFSNLFIGLNENGQVVGWRLTRSTAFTEIEDLLLDLKHRIDAKNTNLEMIFVDDCCSVRPSYNRIFPNVPVKLDIFHACQRFVKTLPKGNSKSQIMANEFGLIFRQTGDTGFERTITTPSPDDMLQNFELFLSKWQNELTNSATQAALHNIRKHIEKGCCSNIPIGAGTNRNERLHKLLKKSLLGGASIISPELAIAVFSVVLYIWSIKREPNAKRHIFNSKVVPVIPIEIKQRNLTFTTSAHINDQCAKFKSQSSPTQIPAEIICAMNSNINIAVNDDNSVLATNADNVEQLKTDTVLAYVLQRSLHLHDLISSLEKKTITRNINILDFPFGDIEKLVKTLHQTTTEQTRDELQFNMNCECLERNLGEFGLKQDNVPGDGNCCFASIANEISKLLLQDRANESDDYTNYLASLGFSTNMESNTTILRRLFCNDVQKNHHKYQEWVDFDIKTEVERFTESGWFNSSLGDLCVLVCSRLLKITIMVITSYPKVPYLPFIPDTIFTNSVIFIAFNHSSPGHYDATKEIRFEQLENLETTYNGSCHCGVMKKQRNAKEAPSCNPSKQLCSCVKNQRKCTPRCKCINCQNMTQDVPKLPSGQPRGCTCGNGKKGVNFIACKNSQTRKSKCPCLRSKTFCSSSCKCLCCGNHGDSKSHPPPKDLESPVHGQKRKRCNPDPYRRASSANYLAEHGFEISAGSWTQIESLILYVVIELIKSTSIEVNAITASALFNFISGSEKVKEMLLPVAYKPMKNIIGKLAYMQSKQNVFYSLLDTCHE